MILYPHQKEALKKTESYNKCAYYLDMGLGKTFVGTEKMDLLDNDINLIICQKSKIQDWIDHIKINYEWMIPYDLTEKKNLTEFVNGQFISDESCSRYMKVGIINYELAWRRKELSHLKDFTLMLDESSLISNEQAKRSKFILRLRPANVILLSGTPVAGKYENLWSQCRLLGWNISKKEFYDSYIITKLIDVGGFFTPIVIGYKHVNELKEKLAEYGAIFMKTDEVIALPDQIEQKIISTPSKEYKYFKKNNYVMIGDKELAGDNSLTKILYERQLCGQYSEEKLKAFKDLLDSTEDRLIVFYNFTAELDAMTKIAYPRQISVISGSTKDLFAYENCSNSITFVQYQAGAMGLNLQKANKIIYFTLPLGKGSCGLWEQSKKRIHRIGQNKPCFYYYLLIKNSIEEWDLNLLQQGKELTDALFRGAHGNDG